MSALHSLNLALRFLLEMAALVALGWWGWQAGTSPWTRALLAAGGPLAAAIAWGLFAAPRAAYDLPAARLAVQVAVLVAAVAALAGLGRPRLAAAFAVVALGNAVLLAVSGR